jgi:hypothetical protein
LGDNYFFSLIADYAKGDIALESTADLINFRVDPHTRTVFTTAHGVLQVGDFVAHEHALVTAGVFAYPQLLDARDAHLKISPSDVHKLVSLMKALRKTHGPAKTAFVTKHPSDFGMMRMYELQIGEHDPGFSAFYDINQAMEWILS